MIEETLRDGMTGALADEPPLSFDPDLVVARAQREIRRRRAMIGVGGATALIAVAAVAATTGLTPAPHSAGASVAAASHLTVGAPAVSTAASTTTIVWPPPGMHVTTYTATQERALADGWTHHLLSTFGTLVPTAHGVAVRPWGGEAGRSVSNGQTYLDTFVTFTVAGHPTAISIQVEAPGHDTQGPAADCARNGVPNCTITREKDGSILTVMDDHPGAVPGPQGAGGGNADTHLVTVTQYRPDGSVVWATGYNDDPTNDRSPGTQPSVLVSVPELTALATDRVLAF